MSKSVRTLILVLCVSGLAGCMIQGVKNTNSYFQLPTQGTYALELDAGDEVIAPRIQRMLDHQMALLGLRQSTDRNLADVVVRWAFDVVPTGSTSTAFTSIQPGRSTATLVGDTAYIRTKPGTATTYSSTTDNFQKTIAVKMFGKNNEKLWEGRVSEVGWCNQIFVTAPHILGLMFDKFPQEAINVREQVNDDPRSEKFKKLFPDGTNWGCR